MTAPKVVDPPPNGPIRIFVHPGYVKSKMDGQEHFISYKQLEHLYGLHPNSAKFREKFEVINAQLGLHRTHKARKNDIHLFPRYDGNYFNYGLAMSIEEGKNA